MPESTTRYEWERVVRRACVSSTVKLVALTLASYANADGSRVYPGVARLAATAGLSERAVRGALGTLRDLGLIERTRKGSSLGRQALTDEHRLRFPDDLPGRVHLLDPDESPASRACDSMCTHPVDNPRSPAPPTGDPDRNTGTSRHEHRHHVPEHRHLTTGTPAPGAPHQPKTKTDTKPETNVRSTYERNSPPDPCAQTAPVIPLHRRTS